MVDFRVVKIESSPYETYLSKVYVNHDEERVQRNRQTKLLMYELYRLLTGDVQIWICVLFIQTCLQHGTCHIRMHSMHTIYIFFYILCIYIYTYSYTI